MGKTLISDHKRRHALKEIYSAIDTKWYTLRRSIRGIIDGFRADQVEEFLASINEVRSLISSITLSEEKHRYQENRHVDDKSNRTISSIEQRHYEHNESLLRQDKYEDTVPRDGQNLDDDSCWECLRLRRCYNCGKPRSNRTLRRKVGPIEQIICSRPGCAWIKAIMENALASHYLIFNIHHHQYHDTQHASAPSSRVLTELPRRGDFLRSLTELPAEDIRREPAQVVMPVHNHTLHEAGPPVIDLSTKPSESYVENVLWQKRNKVAVETTQFMTDHRACSENTVSQPGGSVWSKHYRL